MAHRLQIVKTSDLLYDQSNARLGIVQPSQLDAQIALAKLLGAELVTIAKDIVENGLDPIGPMAITGEGAPDGKFRVIEGNRRLLALRALDTPAIVEGMFAANQRRELRQASNTFQDDPIDAVQCVHFDEEQEAQHWIILRHTGANGGAGLVGWDPNEQERYRARHGGLSERSAAGQVLDFVNASEPPLEGESRRIFTTLQRLIATPKVRTALGIEIESGAVYSHFPSSEVIKGLRTVLNDLRSGQVRVTDVYYEPDRINYIEGFDPRNLPNPATRLSQRMALRDLVVERQDSEPTDNSAALPVQQGTSPTPKAAASTTKATSVTAAQDGTPSDTKSESSRGALRSKVRPPKPRTTTIPNTCHLWIPEGRINNIYHELLRLEVESYPNACAVLLRVFVELSTDHHVDVYNAIPSHKRESTPLKDKLKELASHLHGVGKVSLPLQRAVNKIADSNGPLSASTRTFNQYVHNRFSYPTATELRTAWDELQPFMAVLWAKP